MVLVLRNETQPHLYRLGVPVLDLDQPLMRYTLIVLHGLLMDERTLGDSPALDFLGKRGRSGCGEIAVVGGAQSEIAHEFEIADAVRAELEVAHGKAMGRLTAKGLVVEGLEGEGEASSRLNLVLELFFGEIAGFLLESEAGRNAARGSINSVLRRLSNRRWGWIGEVVLFDVGLAPGY